MPNLLLTWYMKRNNFETYPKPAVDETRLMIRLQVSVGQFYVFSTQQDDVIQKGM